VAFDQVLAARVLGGGGQAAAWTGSELIIVGGTLGDGLARPIATSVNPSTDRWHQLPGFGYLEALDRAARSGPGTCLKPTQPREGRRRQTDRWSLASTDRSVKGP
jgi:hypothetical protein